MRCLLERCTQYGMHCGLPKRILSCDSRLLSISEALFHADDPAGCSHVEPGDTDSDDLRLETYERSAEQAEVIGLSAAPEADGEGAAGGVSGSGAAEEPGTSRQVHQGRRNETRMKYIRNHTELT